MQINWRDLRGKADSWGLQLLASFFIVSTLIGVVRGYSPVPFWDMWEGYLGFYNKITQGHWVAWWDAHNEHRIVLARLLFWMDLTWFRGASVFLLSVNVALIAATAWLVWSIQKQLGEDRKFVGFFLVAWVFFWVQSENLTWAFQSQFILAQLLPFVGFYCLALSAEPRNHAKRLFAVAALLGVLAIGSMANGVLALPLMTIYAVLARLGWKRVCVLLLLSLVFVPLYFYGFHKPGHHGSLGDALRINPIGFVQYVLLFLGSPFYYILGKVEWLAMTMGGVLVMASLGMAWHVLTSGRRQYIQLALLFFILYIGGTVVATAGGRLIFGVSQALAGRYTTPALMAWAALFLLCVAAVPQALWQKSQTIFRWVAIAMLLLMLPQQFSAFHSRQNEMFERRVAALALEMGVKDVSQIKSVYHSQEIPVVEIAREKGWSVFGMVPIQGARESLNKAYFSDVVPPSRGCQGNFDGSIMVDGDTGYYAIRGWVYLSEQRRSPDFLIVVDQKGNIKGRVLTGQTRLDVAQSVGEGAIHAGFRGYVLADSVGPLKLIDPASACAIDAHI